MHIGILTTGYPHRGDPVSGAFVREMARSLAARDHRVSVLCAERPGDAPVSDEGVEVQTVRYLPPDAQRGTFHDEGAPERLRRGDPIAWLGALTFPVASIVEARRRLRDCDALISHFVLPSALVASAIRDERPHLAIGHGTDARWFARLPALLQRAVLNRCTTLRLTHDELRRALAPSVRDDARISVGPMGWRSTSVDPETAGALRRELLAKSGGAEFLALTVARAVPVKGLDVLVRAASLFPSRVHVVIAGDGPERERLARISPPNVTWLGAVEPSRRDALLAASDLFVLPSREQEGAPVALLEAMGAGLPIVATRSGGIEEIVGTAAVIVPAGDAAALAGAVSSLAASATLRESLGTRARRRVGRWHWDAQVIEIEKLLRPPER